MADALTEVVSTLIDAAFSTGGITDVQHTALHAKLDTPAVPETGEAPTSAPLDEDPADG